MGTLATVLSQFIFSIAPLLPPEWAYHTQSARTHCNASDVVERMKHLVAARGMPESITTDNGSEFAGQAMDA